MITRRLAQLSVEPHPIDLSLRGDDDERRDKQNSPSGDDGEIPPPQAQPTVVVKTGSQSDTPVELVPGGPTPHLLDDFVDGPARQFTSTLDVSICFCGQSLMPRACPNPSGWHSSFGPSLAASDPAGPGRPGGRIPRAPTSFPRRD